MKNIYVLLILFFSTSLVISQNQFWQSQNDLKNSDIKNSNKHLPKNQIYTLNLEAMQLILKNVPVRGENTRQSSVILSIPNSEGEFEQFRIIEASVMAPELQLRYPNIRSYAGQGIADPTARIRFSVSPQGLHSMRLSANKSASFIVPLTTDNQIYTVYSRADRTGDFSDFECTLTESANNTISGTNYTLRNANDAILRTYRLAVSATGEYTQYHGGTKVEALAAIVTTMTRVNGIFETDFNVTMELIANTDAVIYESIASDPYGNTTGGYNSELQSTLTSVIGEANYDVGHLFANLQNNGNAGCIGCVCVNGQKGSGWTSAVFPEGEFFDVDYVAHEMGHQFGANHTWTFNGNEGTNVQVEPGSGTTIMSYAGITGATDVEPNVTPNFHAVSIEQVTDYVKTTSCQTNTPTGNAVPVVSAGGNYTIPKGTAFVLDGSATDADTPGSALTYSWEQMDENNASTTYPSTTATTGVAFRAYEPTSETNRYFPRLETVKTGTTSWQWEAVPDVARTLNFRLTVRDNVVGGGTNSSDDVIVTVNGVAGPFVVNSPNTNVTWNADAFATVTWNVAGTTGNGVNAANVDIFLSTDGGDTYPITLATGVTNDGSHDITVPNNQGNQNRVMVRGENNIFFDISDTDFTIGAPVVCNADVPTGLAVSNVGSNTATLDWDTLANASFDIQYRILGASIWNTDSTTANTFDLTGLIPLTQYEVQVRSKCPDNSTSNYSSIINFTTTEVQLNYCNSSSTSNTNGYISNVALNTIDNPSNGTTYSDFTNISTSLIEGTQYSITITPTWSGTVKKNGYSVWIDYNKDGDFNDTGEQVWTQTKTSATPVSGTFTIPSGVNYGSTRMRVSMKFNAIPLPCETGFAGGEVEDYEVFLQYDGLMYLNSTWTPNAPSGTTGSDNALVLNSTYTANTNIALNDLIVNTTATVEVDPSQSIIVNGDLTNSGNLVLNSVSNSYSSLIVNGTVTGDVEYKRHVNAFTASAPGSTGGNDLISAPVVGQNFADFALANPNIYANPGNLSQKLFGPFNKVDDWYQIYDSSANAAVTLDSGIGYRAARDASEDGTSGTTFTFTGAVNTGPINMGILYQGTIYPEWNLIGNPYPSYIKLDAFLAANELNVFDTNSAGVYGYDGDASDGWVVWNQAFSDNYKIENPGSELLITPGQGFFVASQSGGATVSFTSGMRSIGSDDDFISNKNTSIAHLKLEVNNSSEVYATDLYISDNASLGLDSGYDASVFGDVAPDFAIYSQLVNDNQGIDMAIQSVGYSDLSNNVIIPLGINANQGQQLTVSIVDTTLPENTNVYLEDNVANTTTLLNTNDYVFTPATNLSDVGRFFLRFETETLSVIENELNDLVIYNTTSPKVLHIKGQLPESATLYLYDIHGRTVITKQLKSNTNSQQIDISNISTGVYIAKIDSFNTSLAKKIIIQ